MVPKPKSIWGNWSAGTIAGSPSLRGHSRFELIEAKVNACRITPMRRLLNIVGLKVCVSDSMMFRFVWSSSRFWPTVGSVKMLLPPMRCRAEV